MRILILAEIYPDTLACGFKGPLCKHIQGYHRHGHKVDVMAFPDCPISELKRGLIEPYCDNIDLFERPVVPPRQSLQRWLGVLSSPDSDTMKCASPEFAGHLRSVLASRPPDVVAFEAYSMLQYRKYIENIPCVAFAADCKTLALEREKFYNLFRTARLTMHKMKVLRVERTYGSYYAAVFVAQPDADRARELSPNAHIVCIPNGVDVDYFSPAGAAADPETVVFHGSMNFPPNFEAAVWFIKKVWPGLAARHPNARFFVVGVNPVEKILAVARSDNRIVITGSVPDVRVYLEKASVAAVPMQTGSGIKNKVLEGMAMAKPVVLTSMATGGIDHAIPGRHFITADAPEQFADAISDLWRNPDRASLIGANARDMIVKYFSWEKRQDECESILRRAAGMENQSE
jgi:polysaccharide biosynthesis protein PslH